jgi:Protein of unknown function (DUF3307)
MNIFVLLVLYQIKHFLCDYPLQVKFMLGKFKDKDWIIPLSAHCGVHFAFTFLISLYFSKSFSISIGLSCLDFVIHFIMDRIKASNKMLGRYESLSKSEFKGLFESYVMMNGGIKSDVPIIKDQSSIEKSRIEKRFKSNTYFWYALGLDQMVHHLTHYLIIYLLVTK